MPCPGWRAGAAVKVAALRVERHRLKAREDEPPGRPFRIGGTDGGSLRGKALVGRRVHWRLPVANSIVHSVASQANKTIACPARAAGRPSIAASLIRTARRDVVDEPRETTGSPRASSPRLRHTRSSSAGARRALRRGKWQSGRRRAGAGARPQRRSLSHSSREVATEQSAERLLAFATGRRAVLDIASNLLEFNREQPGNVGGRAR